MISSVSGVLLNLIFAYNKLITVTLRHITRGIILTGVTLWQADKTDTRENTHGPIDNDTNFMVQNKRLA